MSKPRQHHPAARVLAPWISTQRVDWPYIAAAIVLYSLVAAVVLWAVFH